MPRSLVLATALLLGSAPFAAPAVAQNVPAEGWRRQERQPRLSPEQQQKLFPERKALLVQQQRERIAILQRSQSCVSAASSSDALRNCLMQERRDQQALRSRFRDQMRALFEQNGIPFPDRNAMPRRRGEPGGRMPQESI